MPKDWDQTLSDLYDRIPDMNKFTWEAIARNDPASIGALIGDVIKVSVSQKGRPGKRSFPSLARATTDYNRLKKQDYSEIPFTQVLQSYLKTKSIRAVASLAHVDKGVIHRLAQGKTKPTIEHIEAIAQAMDKHPSFFIEWRAAYVACVLYASLSEIHESSVVFYNKIKDLERGRC